MRYWRVLIDVNSTISFLRQNTGDQGYDAEFKDASKLRGGSSSPIMLSLFLSLYMLLLAIFILLNSITTFEESRVRQALGSVADKFRTNTQHSDEISSSDERSGDSVLRTQFFSGLEQMFAERLPIAELKIVSDGNVMRTTVPIGDIFRDESMALHPGSDPLTDALADSLVIRTAELRYEIEFLIATGPAFPSGNQLGEVLEIRRAGAFARKLRELGVKSEAISVGLHRGDPKILQMNFYARRVDSASITFDELEVPQ